jgi:hypothetical protein
MTGPEIALAILIPLAVIANGIVFAGAVYEWRRKRKLERNRV